MGGIQILERRVWDKGWSGCGRGAEAGIVAAQLAQIGFTGPPAILEGLVGERVQGLGEPRLLVAAHA